MKRALAALVILALTAAAVAAPRHVRPLRDGEVIAGHFVQERHLAGLTAPLRSEGRFVLAAGRGLIWRAEKPFATVTVLTPEGVSQSVDGKEVQRLQAARVPFLSRFYLMLSGALAGDWSAMEHDFTIDQQDGEPRWTIVLHPRSMDDPASAQLKSITVTGDTFVEAVEIHRANGDWEHLTFLDQALSSAPLSAEDAKLLAAPAP
jgi:Outer membrane lipoprotein carrier protein LolA-like